MAQVYRITRLVYNEQLLSWYSFGQPTAPSGRGRWVLLVSRNRRYVWRGFGTAPAPPAALTAHWLLITSRGHFFRNRIYPWLRHSGVLAPPSLATGHWILIAARGHMAENREYIWGRHLHFPSGTITARVDYIPIFRRRRR